MPEAGIFSYPMHACAFYFISATNKEDFTMKITFPDGSVREFNEGVSAFDVAESIGSRLRKATIACEIDGERADATARSSCSPLRMRAAVGHTATPHPTCWRRL